MLSQDAEMLNYTRAVPRAYEMQAERAPRRVTASAPYSGYVGVLAVLLFLLGLFYGVNCYAAQQSYEMQVVRTDIISLEKQNEVMRLDVARLESPARIQRIAETELGMMVPQHAIYGSSDAYVDPTRIHE